MHPHRRKKVYLLCIFALEPAEHRSRDQWITCALHRLLQTLLPPPGLYGGMDLLLGEFTHCVQWQALYCTARTHKMCFLCVPFTMQAAWGYATFYRAAVQRHEWSPSVDVANETRPPSPVNKWRGFAGWGWEMWPCFVLHPKYGCNIEHSQVDLAFTFPAVVILHFV